MQNYTNQNDSIYDQNGLLLLNSVAFSSMYPTVTITAYIITYQLYCRTVNKKIKTWLEVLFNTDLNRLKSLENVDNSINNTDKHLLYTFCSLIPCITGL